jgi:hypothetical protein
MIKQEESIQIYEKWLGGADIRKLAREFHHWRYVIEDVIRWRAQRQVENMQGLNCRMEARTRERDDLSAVTERWGFAWHTGIDGVEAAKKWYDDYTDSVAAINNKAKLLPGIPTVVYDENGLCLDVKVFEPQKKSEGVQN